MALTSKISDAIQGYRSHPFLSDGIFDVIFDAVTDISENDSFKVSEHTIEDGSDITDHVQNKPKAIDINGILTNDVLDLLDPTSFFADTIQDRKETLEIWREEKSILTYYGHETDIEDVVISNISKMVSGETGDGLALSIGMTVVNIVASQVAAISLSSVNAKGATSKGTAKKAGSSTVKKNRSILKGLTG